MLFMLVNRPPLSTERNYQNDRRENIVLLDLQVYWKWRLVLWEEVYLKVKDINLEGDLESHI